MSLDLAKAYLDAGKQLIVASNNAAILNARGKLGSNLPILNGINGLAGYI